MMSWKPEVEVDGKWYPNGLVFETEHEANMNAYDKFMAWTLTTGHRAVQSDLKPNYRYIMHKLIPIKENENEQQS